MGTNQVNNNSKKNEKEIVDQLNCLLDKDTKFTIQFFGQNRYLNINDINNLSLNEFKYKIIKIFNLKKIESEEIILFYRESNRLSYNKIDSNNFKNIVNNKNIIIKIRISQENTPKDEKELQKFYSSLITSLEIEDILLNDLRLKEKYNNIIKYEKENTKIINNKNIHLKCQKKNSKNEELLILNLFSEILKKRGIKTLIGKEQNDGINSKKYLQNICSGLTEKNKFEFHFIKDDANYLFEFPEKYYFFTEELKKNLSEQLKINPEKIICGPPKKGSIIIPVVFLKDSIKNLNLEEIRKQNSYLGQLTDINKLPLLEYIQLDPTIFDSRYNNKNDNNWGQNEERGKEKYIPPLGWAGYGLNVEDSYDGGEACWLCFGGIYENEFAIAYYPITEEDTDILLGYKIKQNVEIIDNFEFSNLIAKSINSKSRERKEETGEGTIVYQNIEIAEKQASFIDTDYFSFKLIIMCRVRPDRIRAPKDYKEIWILNPNSEEIRPYRILVKLFPKNIQGEPPKNFYKFYNISKIFSQCLLKKDELTIYYNSNYNCSKSEYPIYLYTKNSAPVNEYLLCKKIDNNYTEEKLQSWIWCLHRALTDKTIKTTKMELVKDNTVVYRGICIDNYALSEEFQKGRKLYFGNFVSTSLDREVAKGFVCDNGFLFIITIKNNQRSNYCYKISRISQFSRDNNTEEEILITAFSLFKITDIAHRDNICYIYLDCLGFVH